MKSKIKDAKYVQDKLDIPLEIAEKFVKLAKKEKNGFNEGYEKFGMGMDGLTKAKHMTKLLADYLKSDFVKLSSVYKFYEFPYKYEYCGKGGAKVEIGITRLWKIEVVEYTPLMMLTSDEWVWWKDPKLKIEELNHGDKCG
jgi:hypothetical protein